MREEIRIAGAASSRTDGISAKALAAPRIAGLLAGRFRWVICGLLFLGVTKNYLVQQVLGVLKVRLHHDLGWNYIGFGQMLFALHGAYALGMNFITINIDLWVT